MNRLCVRRVSAAVLCVALMILMSPAAFAAQAATSASVNASYKAQPATNVTSYDPGQPQHLTADNIHATCAILIDAASGNVLFSKDPDRKIYPASTTKVMTALLALEYGNLDDMVKVSQKASDAEPTKLRLVKGEKVRLEDLLYGMMMKSYNDTAVAVAEHIGGSVQGFAELMNKRAKELGCENTNFITPNGLPVKPTDNHYTTAADLAKIAQKAMQYDTFRDIVSTTEYTMAKTNKHNKVRTVRSTDKFLANSGDEQFSYPYGIGVKTGYTVAAAQSFVGAASKNGIELISVVLGSTADGKWEDTIKLMDYGFSCFAPFEE